MIKSLKKRFIAVAMAAVTVLIVVLLGGINALNIRFVSTQNEIILDTVIENEISLKSDSPQEIPEFKKSDKHKRINKPPVEDLREFSVCFMITEKDGEITADVSRIASVDEQEAIEIYKSVSDKSGRTGKFIYKTVELPDRRGTETVFLSTSEQSYAVLRILLLSLLGGLICWSLMLLIVVLLSRRMIRPFAVNFEKQKQFITDAGHEIKTPLAIIMANTEALELHGCENKWTGNIKNQILRLNGLMQNLLLLAKSYGDETQFIKEEFSFSETVEQTAEGFSEFAARRGLEFRTDIDADITLRAVKDQITSLVSILFDNAVKYSSENSVVSVTLRKDRDIRLTVANKCDSLPDCSPENLFDRFFRPDSARSRQDGGYGIGLSAAKAITDYHNGKITAEYKSDNTISFEVTL